MTDGLQTKGKQWYQKPENIAIYGGLGIIGYYTLLGLDKLLPLLNRVLENMLYTTVLFGALGIIAFMVVNGDLHRLVWYGYKSAMRWLTGRFIELDPIGIMRTYVSTLHEKQGQIKKSLGALRGQAESLTELIKTTAKDHETSMGMMAQAKARASERGMRSQMQLQARKAGRAQESALTFQGLLNKILAHIALIEKIDEASNFMILDLEDTISTESKKREMIHASYKAMSAARRILAADKQREMYDMALEATTKDYFNKLGEISQFVEDSQNFITTMDLQNGAYEADALAKLEAWEERSASLLEGGTGDTKYHVQSPARQLVADSGQQVIDAEFEESTKRDRPSYHDLFATLDKKK